MTGSEEHLSHRVPDADSKDEVLDKLNELSILTESAEFEADKSGIEQCTADSNELKEKARPLFKALGFEGKVTKVTLPL
jgi:hypothetical protein